MTNTISDVLKYSSAEYKFIVFRTGGPAPIFWTLERTMADATNRVTNETAAYDSPEWRFDFRPIKRKIENFAHRKNPVTTVNIDW